MTVFLFVFVFNQKTAYEVRISDWSSGVCSSDLEVAEIPFRKGSELFRPGGGVDGCVCHGFSLVAQGDICPSRRRHKPRSAPEHRKHDADGGHHHGLRRAPQPAGYVLPAGRSARRPAFPLGATRRRIAPDAESEERSGGQEGSSSCSTRGA